MLDQKSMSEDQITINRGGYYYKYRSLQNLDRFLSIVMNRQLYGAHYNEMNDPMEGYYQYSPNINKDFLRPIIEGKQKTYICSLSRKGDIGLMWTHYADENRGCCIELKVTSTTWDSVDVDYSQQMPEIRQEMTAKDILRVKAKMWEYEEETRFLKAYPNTKRPMLSIKISRIFIGCNVDRSRFSFLRKLIDAIDPTIEVIKMRKDWLDYGYRRVD